MARDETERGFGCQRTEYQPGSLAGKGLLGVGGLKGVEFADLKFLERRGYGEGGGLRIGFVVDIAFLGFIGAVIAPSLSMPRGADR